MDKVTVEEIRENTVITLRRNPINISVTIRYFVILWLLVTLQLVHMNNLNCLSISDFDIGRVLISIIFHLPCHFDCNLACVSTDNLPEQRSKHENVYYNIVSIVEH